jgi:peroxiredoxin
MGENIELGSKAPDFTLVDTGENEICLSFFEGRKIILLSLIRGFA